MMDHQGSLSQQFASAADEAVAAARRAARAEVALAQAAVRNWWDLPRHLRDGGGDGGGATETERPSLPYDETACRARGGAREEPYVCCSS